MQGEYITRPGIVEAFRFSHSEFPDWFQKELHMQMADLDHAFVQGSKNLMVAVRVNISTAMGTITAQQGDWIVRDAHAEMSVYSNDDFIKKYQPLMETPITDG